MEPKQEKGNVMEKVAQFIVDKRNLFFLIYIAVMIFCMFSMNWKLTLILYAPILPVVLILKFALPKLWKTYSHLWRRSSSMNTMMNDSLSGIRVVKAFAKEDAENEDAINAALYPDENYSEYFYFRHDVRGTIYMAKTSSEHRENGNTVLSVNSQYGSGY